MLAVRGGDKESAGYSSDCQWPRLWTIAVQHRSWQPSSHLLHRPRHRFVHISLFTLFEKLFFKKRKERSLPISIFKHLLSLNIPVPGILTVVNLHKLADVQTHTLNISVSDGVYTSFCRVRVEMVSSNQHSPSVEQHQYDVRVTENQPPGRLVARVSATDPDSGIYGQISYSIPSQLLQQTFSINNLTGKSTRF